MWDFTRDILSFIVASSTSVSSYHLDGQQGQSPVRGPMKGATQG